MLKYWLWLTNLRGLSNQSRLALLRHFGTPEDVFYADEGEVLLAEGITRPAGAAAGRPRSHAGGENPGGMPAAGPHPFDHTGRGLSRPSEKHL